MPQQFDGLDRTMPAEAASGTSKKRENVEPGSPPSRSRTHTAAVQLARWTNSCTNAECLDEREDRPEGSAVEGGVEVRHRTRLRLQPPAPPQRLQQRVVMARVCANARCLRTQNRRHGFAGTHDFGKFATEPAFNSSDNISGRIRKGNAIEP